MRINRYLAQSGVASRRGSDDLVRSGAVRINDKVASLGDEVGEGDVVKVRGNVVRLQAERRVIAYHKPAGQITTARDPQGRPTDG